MRDFFILKILKGEFTFLVIFIILFSIQGFLDLVLKKCSKLTSSIPEFCMISTAHCDARWSKNSLIILIKSTSLIYLVHQKSDTVLEWREYENHIFMFALDISRC